MKAKRMGYYDHPKRIRSPDLAEELGLSRPTFLEHLRKAEGRSLKELLTGQPE